MKKIIKSVMLSLASLLIMFGCSNQASDSTDSPSSTTIENLDPSTLSENGKYFTVEGTTDGIKITLKDDLKIKKDSDSTIQVYDMSKNKLPLMIAASVGSDIQANKKVYTYKFVENNTDYIVKLNALKTDGKWVEDWAKCTAKGGYNLSDYINVDAVKSVKMKLDWDGNNLSTGIESDKLSKKEDLIKDESIFGGPEDKSNYKFMFQFFLVLGKPKWQGAESEWWAWADDIWIDYFRTDFIINSDKYSSRMDDLKNKFNNKYCGYINPKLKLKDGTEYEFEQIWSEQKVFDSSKVSSFAIAGTYTGNVLGDLDSLVINQDKTFLWSKTDGTQFKGTVNYDGNSTVVINMTHQKNNDNDWTENSMLFTGTYSNNTITINESGKSFVFTKQ